MNKILAIGIKDLQLLFRDRAALLLMLLAPYLLTLGFGFVSGAFDDNDGPSGISDIPVAIIDSDTGALGGQLSQIFDSDDLDTLIAVQAVSDEATARQLVDDDELAAVVIVPDGFTDGLIPDQLTGGTATARPVEIYRNPNRPISASVIDAIVTSFVNQVESSVTVNTITIDTLVANGAAAQIPNALAMLQTDNGPQASLITVTQTVGEDQADTLSPFAFLAPGMALFFLMYTVTLGGRSMLQEKQSGTMARMRTTPTGMAQILGGKIVGVFLSGVAQVSILIVASSLMLGVRWGSIVAVSVIIISAAIAATGYGILFASTMKTPSQVAGVGSAVMIVFGAISGTFARIDSPLVNWMAALSPNKWALDSFISIGSGGTFSDILPNIGALWLLAAVLFAISVPLFARQTN